MKTRDEAFQEYQETMDKIDEDNNRKRAEAKLILNEHLATIRASLHKELKAVRDLQQSKGR